MWRCHAAQLLREAVGVDRRFRLRWNERLARRMERLNLRAGSPGELSMTP